MNSKVMKKYINNFPKDISDIIKEDIQSIIVFQKYKKVIKQLKKVKVSLKDEGRVSYSKIKKNKKFSTTYYKCPHCDFLHFRTEYHFGKRKKLFEYYKEDNYDDCISFCLTFVEKVENGVVEEIDYDDYVDFFEN